MELIIACCIAIHDDHVASYNIASPFSCESRAQVALKSTASFTGTGATLSQTKNNYG